jgi:hypothetical protein
VWLSDCRKYFVWLCYVHIFSLLPGIPTRKHDSWMQLVLPIAGIVIMVAIAAKARRATAALLGATALVNISVNNWLYLSIADPRRDILRHDFSHFTSMLSWVTSFWGLSLISSRLDRYYWLSRHPLQRLGLPG